MARAPVRTSAEVRTLELLIHEESKFANRIRDVIQDYIRRQTVPLTVQGALQEQSYQELIQARRDDRLTRRPEKGAGASMHSRSAKRGGRRRSRSLSRRSAQTEPLSASDYESPSEIGVGRRTKLAESDSYETTPFQNSYKLHSGVRRVTDIEAIYPAAEQEQAPEPLPFTYRMLLEAREGKTKISARDLRPVTNRWGVGFRLRKNEMIDRLIAEYERRYQDEVKRTWAEMEVERLEAIRRGRKKRGRPRKVQ